MAEPTFFLQIRRPPLFILTGKYNSEYMDARNRKITPLTILYKDSADWVNYHLPFFYCTHSDPVCSLGLSIIRMDDIG